MTKPPRGSRQPELLPRSKRPIVPIAQNHRLVELADIVDWTELEQRANKIRASKLKSAAGRPPHMRVMLGAMILRSTRYMPYRVLEDQIRYYAPARYLCGLTETEWSPDHNTLHDFIELMGEEGARLVNEYVVEWAVEEKLADPRTMVADTTAQEAAVPYPNEPGLMSSFLRSLSSASRRAGSALKKFAAGTAKHFEKAKAKLREYRLFAKSKTKQQKDHMTGQMVSVVEKIQGQLGKALKAAAAGKIVSVHVPQLYSVVRGKVGKKVEFGLSWGMRRVGGGFMLATLAKDRNELHDKKFAVSAIDEHVALFGKAPESYAYDRGGWSEDNVATICKRGVKHVGLAPQGKAKWKVSGKARDRLVNERARIEGGIGTIKHQKYGFNRPAARSARMMGTCGQLAVLGFNLNKLVRELAGRRKVALVG